VCLSKHRSAIKQWSVLNGTVNWKGIYGEDAFILRPPVYESMLRERRQYKTVDAEQLAKKAQEYAQVILTSAALTRLPAHHCQHQLKVASWFTKVCTEVHA